MKTAHCVGLFIRSGFPASTDSYSTTMGGAVVNDAHNVANGGLKWSQMQTTAGSPVGSGALGNGGTNGNGTDAIDQAWAFMRAHPSLGWTAKIRIFAGVWQPDWIKNLYGTVSNGSQTLTPFWTTQYRSAYANFLLQLAAYVPAGETLPLDLNPLFGEMVAGGDMTTYAEPMLLTGWSMAQLGNPTQVQLQTALNWTIADTVAAFPNTPVCLAYNPCAYGGETFTEAAMLTLRAAVSDPLKAVLGNNSLLALDNINGKQVSAPTTANDPNTGAPWATFGTYADPKSYTAMYTKMAQYNALAQANTDIGHVPISPSTPIYIQLDTYGKMSLSGTAGTPTGLKDSLSYAIWLGARMIELNGGYTNLTPTELGNYNAGLIANDPQAASTPIIQHLTGSTSAGSTMLTVNNTATQAGNTLVLIIGARGSSAPSISVSGGGAWSNRASQNTNSLTGNLSGWDLVPTGSVGANGITIISSIAGSIEYEFWEITGLSSASFESVNVFAAASSTTAPTLAITPSNSADIVVAGIFWPGTTQTISALPSSPWTNDPTVVGVG